MMNLRNSKRAGRCLFYETKCTRCRAQARAAGRSDQRHKKRYDNGEKMGALAAEYGVTRQTFSTYLNPKKPQMGPVCRTYRAWVSLNGIFDKQLDAANALYGCFLKFEWNAKQMCVEFYEIAL